nr:2-hydroxyacyl-CoA dehydratase family protein [uncultured Methanospirillum sp.]
MNLDYPLFQYPEEIKPLVLDTPDLVFRDGRQISSQEIWDFMTIEGPRRYPYQFSTNPSYGHQMSRDFSYISGIRKNYLSLTGMDRLKGLVRKGVPLIMEPGGISSDLYYAAGCIPVVPHFLRGWIMHDHCGQDFKGANVFGTSIFEEARQGLNIECCNLISPLTLLKNKNIPIAAIAPCLCSRCSDMAFAAEAYHLEYGGIPTIMMDYPPNHDGGEWRVEYIKEEMIALVEQLGKISGKEVTDADLRREIQIENISRHLTQECQHKWWNAKVPPTNSIDSNFSYLGLRGSYDYQVTNQILQETRDEVTERVQKGIVGLGLSDDPVRLFICGSCVRPNPYFVDTKGGVLVGRDDGWSTITMEVKETGDPYENLAMAYASLPYERSTEERAEWTVNQIRNSRADGVIFMYNWGCNYQSAVSEMIIDIIKEKTGLPTLSIELEVTGQMESSEQSQNRVESFIEMVK